MVYVITHGEYEFYHICAVTLDRYKAEKLRKLYSCDEEIQAKIEEYEEDVLSSGFFSDDELVSEPIKYYRVRLCSDGTRRNYANELYTFGNNVQENTGQFGRKETCFTEIDRGVYYAKVFTDSEDEAIKIAQDMYVQALAECSSVT